MKVAAYCRVSTDKEEQLASLANQKAFFIEYTKRNGHELFHLYADEGISGTSLKRRDAFNRLMQDARCGFFQAVVVKDISRLARNTVDFLISIRELKAMGINVIFLNANMDSMGDSEFILTLFSAMAQEESANLSKRTKFGKRLNAEKGRVPQKLFGYDRIDNFTLAINRSEAGIVRKIFSLYNEKGLGCRTISLTLNQDGDRTKYGNEWNTGGVRRILVNPIYKGTLVNHKYETEDFLTGKQVSIPPEEHFCHERPDWAIVSPEVFQKAQDIMSSAECNIIPASHFVKPGIAANIFSRRSSNVRIAVVLLPGRLILIQIPGFTGAALPTTSIRPSVVTTMWLSTSQILFRSLSNTSLL